jgi:hypothetical protein
MQKMVSTSPSSTPERQIARDQKEQRDVDTVAKILIWISEGAVKEAVKGPATLVTAL